MSCDLVDERPGYRQSMLAVSFPKRCQRLLVAAIKKSMCSYRYDGRLVSLGCSLIMLLITFSSGHLRNAIEVRASINLSRVVVRATNAGRVRRYATKRALISTCLSLYFRCATT
jgi:hypothetical protein